LSKIGIKELKIRILNFFKVDDVLKIKLLQFFFASVVYSIFLFSFVTANPLCAIWFFWHGLNIMKYVCTSGQWGIGKSDPLAFHKMDDRILKLTSKASSTDLVCSQHHYFFIPTTVSQQLI